MDFYNSSKYELQEDVHGLFNAHLIKIIEKLSHFVYDQLGYDYPMTRKDQLLFPLMNRK